jgi:folate-binding protein YgfZ
VPDLTADYLAFRREAGAVWLPRDFVVVSGPGATTFLQGQLSQDIAALAAGGSTWALLLQPQGKLVAFLRVLREGDDRYVLETDAGYGPVVIERLNRFKLRVKADIEPLAWRCLAVRGPKAHEVAGDERGAAAASVQVVADWPGLPGVDLVGEDPQPPEGVRLCSLDAYEAVRIEAGIPVMGRELDESTIPAEAGVVERSVSFTKGCYTGQELVARIDSRGGNVPRRLQGVIVGTNVLPPPGASLRAGQNGEKDVGRLTSVAESLDRRAPVALAYVGRAVTPPADVTVVWEGGSAPGRVEPLPLVS